MKAFYKEIQRRKVFRVAAVYLFASWLLMQVGDVVFPALRLPEWSITLLVSFLILGFPVVLILSWIYDITSDGIKRTENVDTGSPASEITVRNSIFIIIKCINHGFIF